MSMNVMIAGKDRDNLKTIIRVLRQEKNINMLVCLKGFSETVEKFEKGNIDAVFIDTDTLQKHTGKCIKALLKRYNKTRIILISRTTDYLNLAFDTMAAGYIIKPVRSSDVSECVKRLSKLNTDRGFSGIIVRLKGRDIFVSYSDILFVEASNRNCIVHTQKEEYRVSKTLADIAGELPEDIFFRSHRSYIINISNIKYIDKFNNTSSNVFFDGNKVALLSRRCEKLFKEKIEGNLD